MVGEDTSGRLRRRARPVVRVVRSATRRLETELAVATARFGGADVSLFHEFAPPPTGGAHQFLRALVRELDARGVRVESNTLSRGTAACLFNSFNFDFRRLERLSRPGVRMVHRVDGPIATYRGWDDGTDARLAALNRQVAHATVFQSRFSLEGHREQGFELAGPVVIPNAVDSSIFHPPDRRAPLQGRKVRIVASSWSDNPNKGAETYLWLERNLDWSRYEFTFVGRTSVALERARVVPPVPSAQVAEILREHDVYLAASLNDPCSNALLEALACGLPAVYAQSGGHPELVGGAGAGFSDRDELLERLDEVAADYESRRAQIRVPALADVAAQYLAVLGVE